MEFILYSRAPDLQYHPLFVLLSATYNFGTAIELTPKTEIIMRFNNKGEFKLWAPHTMGANIYTVITTIAAVSICLDNTSYSVLPHSFDGAVSNIASRNPNINPTISINNTYKGTTKYQPLELCYKLKNGIAVLNITNTKCDFCYNYKLK